MLLMTPRLLVPGIGFEGPPVINVPTNVGIEHATEKSRIISPQMQRYFGHASGNLRAETCLFKKPFFQIVRAAELRKSFYRRAPRCPQMPTWRQTLGSAIVQFARQKMQDVRTLEDLHFFFQGSACRIVETVIPIKQEKLRFHVIAVRPSNVRDHARHCEREYDCCRRPYPKAANMKCDF